MIKLHLGNNLNVLDTLPDNSVDSIITDSPYGLGKEPDAVKCLQDWIDHGYHEITGKGFMGKSWDGFVPQPILWKKCYRVLKPGGHLLSFFGTRTYDWGTLAIRLAGFEIRDCIFWVYGSGFPKSLDISKAIDKAAGAEREIIGKKPGTYADIRRDKETGIAELHGGGLAKDKDRIESHITAPATDDAKKWNGYGTALKPACEPICVARKPLEGTVIENVLKYGTGGINIDAGRVGTEEKWENSGELISDNPTVNALQGTLNNSGRSKSHDAGRWPANIIHDGSDEVVREFPQSKGQQGNITGNEPSQVKTSGTIYGGMKRTKGETIVKRSDEGSAARFFYCAKASPAERAGRKHPTIKPLALMEYLVKVFGGAVVLDPFMGSGTTGLACANTGKGFIGIEADKSSYDEAMNLIYDDL